MTLHLVKVAALVGLSLVAAAGGLVLAGKGLAGAQVGDGSRKASALDRANRMRDLVEILGTWTVVEIGQVNHQPTEEERAHLKTGAFTISLTADRITFNQDRSSVRYQLDPRKTPGTMMLTHEDASGKKTVQLAIYSLDGDNLKICMGRGAPGSPPEAPASFDIKAAPPGTSPTLFVMKRKLGPLAADEAPPWKGEVLEFKNDPKGWVFDDGYSMDLPGGKDDVLFIDLDTRRYMTPPFDLKLAEPGRPLDPTNLAFPQALRDWIRFQGLDVAAQSDGKTITLVGLETKEGSRLPASSKWFTTKLEALMSINTNLRQADPWLRFLDTFQEEDRSGPGNHGLPFATREAGLGILSLRLNRRAASGKESIRLDCRIDRGMNLAWESGSQGRPFPIPARKIPEPSILGPLPSGALKVSVRDAKIVLRRVGDPDLVEVGQGKVVVRALRDKSSEVLLEAGQIGTPIMRLDGRREEITFPGRDSSLRRNGEQIELVGGDRHIVRSESLTLTLPGLRAHVQGTDEPAKPGAR
jgi:uncharacterized protein (TIGR03067 family)